MQAAPLGQTIVFDDWRNIAYAKTAYEHADAYIGEDRLYIAQVGYDQIAVRTEMMLEATACTTGDERRELHFRDELIAELHPYSFSPQSRRAHWHCR